MAQVPTMNNGVDEPQGHVMDQLLDDPGSNTGNLLPSFNLIEY